MFTAALKPRRFAIAFLKRYAAKCQTCETRTVSLLLRREVDHRVSQSRNPGIEILSRYSTQIENNINFKQNVPLNEDIEHATLHMLLYNIEDVYAHDVLKNRKAYAGTILLDLPFYGDEVTKEEVETHLTKMWALEPIPEIIEAFKRVSYFASKNNECIADEKYTKMLKYLAANAMTFTDSELADIIKGLALWPPLHSRKDTNFIILFEVLDKECLRRAARWTIDEVLLMTDHWYAIKMTRYSSFCSWVISRLGSRAKRLSPKNLVQYMFYASTARIKSTNMYDLEYRLESCIDDLDMEELAIVSLGFFKTQTPIRNSCLLDQMMNRTMAEMETIDNISLAAILKIVGYSYMVLTDNPLVPKLLMSTLPQIQRISTLTLVHVITVLIKLRLFQPELLITIAKRYNEEISDVRLKDLERLILGLSVFNFTPDFQPNIYETIVDEIRKPERQDELKRHRKLLGRILRFLSVVNVYPKDLTATVLDPEYLKEAYGDSPYKIGEEILSVDLNIDVEVPDYTGPRLDDESRVIIAKTYVNKLPDRVSQKLTTRQIFLLEILDCCEDIFGSNEIAHADWLLPQYRDADVVICLDENNQPVSVKNIFAEIPFGYVKRRPENYPEGYKWLAIIIAARNCFMNDTPNLLGKDVTKLRQLKRIGYTPIVVSWYDWYAHGKNKMDYLKTKLYQS